MSLALRSGDIDDEEGFFIYFDAITSYSRNYTGTVTKHPLDSGASVVDHFVADNPTITISGVVTGVDVSTGSFNITDMEGNRPYNVQQAPNAVTVLGGDDSLVSRFIPSSIGQFLPNNNPQIVMDSARVQVIEQIRDALRTTVVGSVINEETGREEPNVQLVQLYEYTGTVLNRVIKDLVITSVTFPEDANSGEGLYFDITFEQVKFVGIRREAVPSEFIKPMEPQTTEKDSMGRQDSVVESEEETPQSNLLIYGRRFSEILTGGE